MIPYKNLSGNSGVTGYEIGFDYIKVKFQDDYIYLYTNKSAGPANISQMKKLAVKGRGLSTFISKYVKKEFESKSI